MSGDHVPEGAQALQTEQLIMELWHEGRLTLDQVRGLSGVPALGSEHGGDCRHQRSPMERTSVEELINAPHALAHAVGVAGMSVKGHTMIPPWMKEEPDRFASFVSFLEAVRAIEKQHRGKKQFYPDLYWKDVLRYLKLVQRGAIFRVNDDKRLVWDLPEQSSPAPGREP